jgi:hypothetical protein
MSYILEERAMSAEHKVLDGEFYSDEMPQVRRPFDVIRINDLAVEVRYRDGHMPMVLSAATNDVRVLRNALEQATDLKVKLGQQRCAA